MPLSNPAVPRFDWVARNFPLAVLVRTFQVWANTVGADTWVGMAAGVTSRAERQKLCEEKGVCLPHQYAHWFVEWIEHQIQFGLGPSPSVPGIGYPPPSTPYDRYMPWVASVINRSLRALWKEADSAIVRMPDNFALGLDDYSPTAQATGHGPAPVLAPSQATRYAFHQAAREYQDTYNLLRNELRLLVAYAEAEGIDLGTVKTAEELERFSARATAWSADQVPTLEPVEGYVMYRFPDNWTVQLLNSQEALDYEGAAMNHCVADYADPHDEHTSYFSLRDPEGHPHVTIEHDLLAGGFAQVKGAANSVPKPEYLKRVACWRLRSELRGGPGHEFLKRMPKKQRRPYQAATEWVVLEAWLDDRDPGEGWLLMLEEGSVPGKTPRAGYLVSTRAGMDREDADEEGLADDVSVAWPLWRQGYAAVGGDSAKFVAELSLEDELVEGLLGAGILWTDVLNC